MNITFALIKCFELILYEVDLIEMVKTSKSISSFL